MLVYATCDDRRPRTSHNLISIFSWNTAFIVIIIIMTQGFLDFKATLSWDCLSRRVDNMRKVRPALVAYLWRTAGHIISRDRIPPFFFGVKSWFLLLRGTSFSGLFDHTHNSRHYFNQMFMDVVRGFFHISCVKTLRSYLNQNASWPIWWMLLQYTAPPRPIEWPKTGIHRSAFESRKRSRLPNC